MTDAVICEPIRTPVGGFGGALREVNAPTLAATVSAASESTPGSAEVQKVLVELQKLDQASP